jgi:hypothetical protein
MNGIRVTCAFVLILVSTMSVFAFLVAVPSSPLAVRAESIFTSARASMNKIESPITSTAAFTAYIPLAMDSCCHDGIPAVATRVNFDAPDFLRYDETNYDVFQTVIHCRTVTVAIAKNFGSNTYDDRTTLKDYIFETWNTFWNEFGGFPFKYYTVVIGYDLPYDAEKSGRGEMGEGFETSWDPYLTNYEYYSHGMYHAWNGNAFRQYQEGRWFMEGVTEYYGLRQSKGYYTWGLNYAYQRYIETYNAGRDMALCSINDQGNPDWLHYWKGGLVAYMLDRELATNGHHLGEVARVVYQRYGVLSQGTPTDSEFLSILTEVSGRDFTDFYNKYICGTAPLPLDGVHFDWISHD